MIKRYGAIIKGLLISVCLIWSISGTAHSEEYKALTGLKSVKAVFDFRAGDINSAMMQLDMISQIFHDKNIQAVTEKPEFVIVFIGPSVKLISKNRDAYSAEDQKKLEHFADMISKMSGDGVTFEICLIATKIMGVDPASILPGITGVNSGWISLIGYQAKDYSIVPAY
ncbi:MAG: DsrE family protein [Nitrospirota bacterium]